MYTQLSYKEKTALIEQVIDNFPAAVIVLDSQTNIVLANKVAEMFANKSRLKLFGMRGGEAFGCIHSHDDPQGCGYGDACRECVVRNTVESTIKTKKDLANVEAPMTFFDKGNRILSLATTWLDENQLVIVALNDITYMKNQEKMTLHNTKLHAAVKTGGAVCHEMNQPLSVINGYIELINLDAEDVDVILGYLTEIKIQVRRLAHLTSKLMNITRFEEMDYLTDTILDIEKSSSFIGNV